MNYKNFVKSWYKRIYNNWDKEHYKIQDFPSYIYIINLWSNIKNKKFWDYKIFVSRNSKLVTFSILSIKACSCVCSK